MLVLPSFRSHCSSPGFHVSLSCFSVRPYLALSSITHTFPDYLLIMLHAGCRETPPCNLAITFSPTLFSLALNYVSGLWCWIMYLVMVLDYVSGYGVGLCIWLWCWIMYLVMVLDYVSGYGVGLCIWLWCWICIWLWRWIPAPWVTLVSVFTHKLHFSTYRTFYSIISSPYHSWVN